MVEANKVNKQVNMPSLNYKQVHHTPSEMKYKQKG